MIVFFSPCKQPTVRISASQSGCVCPSLTKMDPLTNLFTLTTGTSSSNDASNYPEGQFVDPAYVLLFFLPTRIMNRFFFWLVSLLQLNATANPPPNRSHQQAAEMAWNPPGLFQTQNLSYLSGSSPFGGGNDHTFGGTFVGTTTGPSTASRPMPPQASAPYTTMPTYARSEGYIPPSFRNL